MDEKSTKKLPTKLSFEERVFARFDSIDARFDTVEARFDTVEARLEKLEARGYDTKPIWERALKEIQETNLMGIAVQNLVRIQQRLAIAK